MTEVQLSPEIAVQKDFITLLANALETAKEQVGIDFDIVNASLYGSVVKGKTSPNDIDVFIEIDVNTNLELAESLGFEFDEQLAEADAGSNVDFQSRKFLTELVHDFLHGLYPEFRQPVFNGTPVDICVSMMKFEDFWGFECPRTLIQMQ